MLRIPCASHAVVALALVASLAGAWAGCLGVAPREPEPSVVVVRPRIQLDGALALHARGARVVVDEVLVHAPSVLLRSATGEGLDVLETDPLHPGPLVFRYDIRSDNLGDVVGGARRWLLPGAGEEELVFGFAPLDADASRIADLEAQSGVPLDPLAGHTAAIHGSLLLDDDSSTSSGFANRCQVEADAAPEDGPGASAEGNPAVCETETRSDGDPDGNPADGAPENDGDPDGNPAAPDDTRDDAVADNDDAAAATNEDGDPDGNPARPTPSDDDNTIADEGTREDQRQGEAAKTGLSSSRPTHRRVPFVLVVNRAFLLAVPLQAVMAKATHDDEILPIDLRVRLDELIDADVLALLQVQATRHDRSPVVVEVPDACAALDVAAPEAQVHVDAAAGSGGIRVVGGLR